MFDLQTPDDLQKSNSSVPDQKQDPVGDITQLSEDALKYIHSFLSAQGTAHFAGTCRLFRAVVTDDVWLEKYRRDFPIWYQLEQKKRPVGSDPRQWKSYKQLYQEAYPFQKEYEKASKNEKLSEGDCELFSWAYQGKWKELLERDEFQGRPIWELLCDPRISKICDGFGRRIIDLMSDEQRKRWWEEVVEASKSGTKISAFVLAKCAMECRAQPERIKELFDKFLARKPLAKDYDQMRIYKKEERDLLCVAARCGIPREIRVFFDRDMSRFITNIVDLDISNVVIKQLSDGGYVDCLFEVFLSPMSIESPLPEETLDEKSEAPLDPREGYIMAFGSALRDIDFFCKRARKSAQFPIIREVYQRVVEREHDLSTKISDGRYTPFLHIATALRLQGVVSDLIDFGGIDINQRRHSDGRSPLHIAAEFGFPEEVEWLLAHGADPFATTTNGETALQCATRELEKTKFEIGLSSMCFEELKGLREKEESIQKTIEILIRQASPGVRPTISS